MRIARFFLFTFSLFLVPTAYSQIRTFISYDQFLEFSDSQKKSYIEMLRKYSVDLSQNPYLTSSAQSRQSRLDQLLQQFVSIANAGESDAVDRECGKSITGLSNQDLLSAFGLTLNCTEIRSTRSDPLYYSPVAIKRVESLTSEFFSRVEAQTLTPREPYYLSGIGALKAAIEDVKKNGTRTQKIDPSWLSHEYNRLTNMESNGSRGSAKINNPKLPATAPKPTAVSQPELKKESAHSYRCLYAGFVIPKTEGNKCAPHKELPFASSFLDQRSFLCSEPEQILCNPLLFGFEETDCATTGIKTCKGKRPVCVYRSKDATKNCYETAKRKKTINQTLEIWKSPEGEKLYKDFIESLEQLCDTENLKQRKLKPVAFEDISKTCEVANSVLKENIQNEFLNGQATAPAADKSSGKQ